MEVITEFLRNNDLLFKLILAVAEIAAGFALAPLIRSAIMRLKLKGVDQAVLTFSSSAVSIVVKAMAIIIALAQIGVDMAVVVGAFSAIGLGVSLSLKESMANVAGGLQILITKPFTVGDYIAMGEAEGTCKQVELMFTILQTPNGQEVIIPNAQIVSTTLINYSQYPVRRILITIPVAIQGSYASLRAELQEVMESNARVLKDPIPKTVINGFTAAGNGLEIRMICYTQNTVYWDVLYQLNEQVHQLLIEHEIQQPTDVLQVAGQKKESASV